MQQLQVIEHDARRVLTTSQLADSFDTNSKIIARNFQRNQGHYEPGNHYYVLAGEDLKAFKASRPDDANLKYVSVLYLWTEAGAWLHAKSLNTQRAWEAYQKLIDSYYKLSEQMRVTQANVKSTSPLIPTELTEALNKFESRLIALEKLRDEITLHSGEQKRLRNAVSARVYQLAKKETGARSTLFSALYSAIYERYGVLSYRDVKKDDLQDALRFVEGWNG